MTLTEYKQKYGLRKMGGFGGYPCANTLLYGNSRRCHGGHDACLPPGLVRDHHSGFRTKDGSIVMVFQPYFGPDETPSKNSLKDISAAANAWAAEKNLTCRISAEDSWHFPGKTVLVEFRKKK
jgi:hypothetical protein